MHNASRVLQVCGVVTVSFATIIAQAETRAWWRFETMGATVPDSSGNAVDGQMVGMYTGAVVNGSGYSIDVPSPEIVINNVTSLNTQALFFDGYGDYVQFTNHLSALELTNTTTAFTIECFFKVVSTNFPMRFLQFVDSLDPQPRTTISPHLSTYGNPPQLAFTLQSDDASDYETIFAGSPYPSPIAYNNWHHVAFVKSGSNLTWYLDYQFIDRDSSDEIEGPFTGLDLCWLCKGSGYDNFFHGGIDEMRFSDEALDPSEFIHVPNGLPPFCRNLEFAGDVSRLTFVSQSGSVYRVDAANTSTSYGFDWFNLSTDVTGDVFYTYVIYTNSPGQRYLRVSRPLGEPPL